MSDLSEDDPNFQRIVDQRLRNRIIENLEAVAEGDAGVLKSGYQDYFEDVFDFAPYEGPPEPNSAFTREEELSFADFLARFRHALNETPKDMAENDFIRTGWPAKLSIEAFAALSVFRKRGKLSEERFDPR